MNLYAVNELQYISFSQEMISVITASNSYHPEQIDSSTINIRIEPKIIPHETLSHMKYRGRADSKATLVYIICVSALSLNNRLEEVFTGFITFPSVLAKLHKVRLISISALESLAFYLSKVKDFCPSGAVSSIKLSPNP